MDLMTREPETLLSTLEQWARDLAISPETSMFYYGLAQYPPMNISMDEGNLYLRAEVPGMKLDDFKMTVTGSNLRIQGEKKIAYQECQCSMCAERPFGEFDRVIRVPNDADTDKIGAKYEKGILTITMPRKEEAKPRPIQVERG